MNGHRPTLSLKKPVARLPVLSGTGSLDKAHANDAVIIDELLVAGIPPQHIEWPFSGSTKAFTHVSGLLHGWTFHRDWYFWIAKGPGIDVIAAENLHEQFGKELRVDGLTEAPSPRDHFKGFGCGHYQIDTPRALKALAETLNHVADMSKAIQEARRTHAAVAALRKTPVPEPGREHV